MFSFSLHCPLSPFLFLLPLLSPPSHPSSTLLHPPLLLHRRVFALNETSSGWVSRTLCMGGADVCTGGLVGTERERAILSFGEDEEGELYILTSSSVVSSSPDGAVYRIVDPARCVCSQRSFHVHRLLLCSLRISLLTATDVSCLSDAKAEMSRHRPFLSL